jgi:Fur family ferric uptake transcriptional regulator
MPPSFIFMFRVDSMDNRNIKQAGLKVTAPRVKILQLLESRPHDERHLTAEELHRCLIQEGAEIGLATVYRVLTQFESAGLVKRHHFEGNQSVFELDQGEHHDHIVCVRCGRVEEFSDPSIEQRQEEIAAARGFEMTDHVLCLYGICLDCQGQTTASRGKRLRFG